MSDYPDLRAFIDGAWLNTPGGIDVVNPANGKPLAVLPDVGPQHLDAAVRAAWRGFHIWRKTAPAERRRIMLEAVRLMRERQDTIARVMTMEQGKPIAQSRLEVERACGIIEWDANEGLRTYGRIIPAASDMNNAVHRKSIGPVAAFTPWNFPASGPARKIGGALAAGCSLVLKPAEETPATALLMARAFQEAGLPPGVLNLVFGAPSSISSFLVPRPEIRLVAFTGSVTVGKKLASLAGAHMKPVVMELGGHSPVIVCRDTDPVLAAAASFAAKARNAGQVCVAPTRFFIHEAVHETFLAEFTRLAKAIVIGDGLDPATGMGPLANPRRVASMESLVTNALDKGASLAAGGERPVSDGFYYPMTVLDNVPDDARCMVEEPFGPLALMTKFSHLDEAMARANALPYALAAYAYTDSASTIASLADDLDCGNLAVNHMTASLPETPFGGVKDSGYGREGGSEGLESYLTSKLVSVKSLGSAAA